MDTSPTLPSTLLETRITSQGQVSVPAAIRRQLGVAPGSTLQWTMRDGEAVVRARKGVTFEDMHKTLFPDGPPKPISTKQMKEAIANYVREKHARR